MDKVQLEKCPVCKSRLWGPVKYCPFCGKNVEEISPPPPPPPKYGPMIKGFSISAPGESGAVEVTAVTHSEDGLNIAGAEWWIGDDPGPGNGNPMKAGDGSFKSSRVDITASIDISDLKPGNYQINVRSADVRGVWGSPQTITLTVPTKEEPPPPPEPPLPPEPLPSPPPPPPPPPPPHWLRKVIVGILIAACLFIGYKIVSRPKEKAQISVSTSPSGASLTIDGQNMGRTPKTGILIDSGTHHIKIEKGGYLRTEQEISVGPGEKKSLIVTLKKGRVDSAELNITTTPDQAVVFIDGEKKGATPLALKNITPGEHSLTISKAGYENRNEQIKIAGGEKKNLEYALSLPKEAEKKEPSNASEYIREQLFSEVERFYKLVEKKNVDGAFNMFALKRQPEVNKKLIEAVAKDTEYYHIDKRDLIELREDKAKVHTFLYHKKYKKSEEYWEITVEFVKENNEWKIWSTPGKPIR